MKTNTITNIKYTKATSHGSGEEGEVTHRDVIFTHIPTQNTKALDVTDLSEEDQLRLLEWQQEYAAYFEQQMKQILGFGDWLEQSKQITEAPIKYRTFKLGNIEVS